MEIPNVLFWGKDGIYDDVWTPVTILVRTRLKWMIWIGFLWNVWNQTFFVGETPWMGFMESYDHSILC